MEPYTVTQKPLPTIAVHKNQNYKLLNSRDSLDRHEKKDTEGIWPTEARRLKEWTIFTYAALCWDIFLTLSPVIFIGKFVLSFLSCSSNSFFFNYYITLLSLMIVSLFFFKRSPVHWTKLAKLQNA